MSARYAAVRALGHTIHSNYVYAHPRSSCVPFLVTTHAICCEMAACAVPRWCVVCFGCSLHGWRSAVRTSFRRSYMLQVPHWLSSPSSCCPPESPVCASVGLWVLVCVYMCVFVHMRACLMCVGWPEPYIYTVYIPNFWHGNHQIYGHTRCKYTAMANRTRMAWVCKHWSWPCCWLLGRQRIKAVRM